MQNLKAATPLFNDSPAVRELTAVGFFEHAAKRIAQPTLYGHADRHSGTDQVLIGMIPEW